MSIADYIAKLIHTMLEQNQGVLELKRNDMAEELGCAPSQISYVITSRFTPQQGYIVESQRGGGGYIRIVRKQMHVNECLMHFFQAVGDSLSEAEAYAFLRSLADRRVVEPSVAGVLSAPLSNTALADIPDKALRDMVRASLMRQMMLALMR
ncbi:MAG: CtsR family transcriptional regulator [Eubacteriales bacterium]